LSAGAVDVVVASLVETFAAGEGATAGLSVAGITVGGGLAAVTTIVACIHGCGVQM
jgi:hypothetical protein